MPTLAAALRYRYSHNTYAVELDGREIGHIEMHGDRDNGWYWQVADRPERYTSNLEAATALMRQQR